MCINVPIDISTSTSTSPGGFILKVGDGGSFLAYYNGADLNTATGAGTG